MPRPVLTGFLIASAIIIAFAICTDRRADLREAEIEARYPPTGQMVKVDGRMVHVIVRGAGPDLVLIHGAGSNARDMALALADCLEDRYRLFIPDRPGHGWTDREPALKGAFNTQAESPADQAALLAAAVKQLGATNPIVAGHSFGGAVAMAWALDHPHAATVIISGVTLPWPGEVNVTYRLLGSSVGSAIIAPVATAFITKDYVRSAANGTFTPQSAPETYYETAGIPLAIRTASLRANNQQVNTLRPYIVEQSKRYDTITTPIEIVHGTNDTTVFASIHAEPLAARMDNVHFTPLPGLGHMPHYVVPDGVTAAIDRAAARAGLR
ncbi:haloalkane dehalogenase [Boseongicola aestuarii]|uniref:Haloalkane dehalogenase n=1 Tax=Boseongicola aestuarii TaxID=1470561 RepID=A0A238IW94_9RHOB|nr:haloalkane dehalogenase [Boseongicola aestuarii]